MVKQISVIVSAILAMLCAPYCAYAQCTGQWLPGGAVPGVSGVVNTAVMWDPDGPGPQPPVLVVGGNFQAAGSTQVNNIAYWDGTSWSALGSGAANGVTSPGSLIHFDSAYRNSPDVVNALAVMPNGDLVVGGTFNAAGGLTANAVARFSVTTHTWSTIGTGTEFPNLSAIYALAIMPNGDLIAGGYSIMHRWDGTSWSSVSGGTNNTVNALVVMPNGSLVVGGNFDYVGDPGNPIPQTQSIASWNGTSWSSISGAASAGAIVKALAVMPNGQLIVGGSFSKIGNSTISKIASWDGSTWSSLGFLLLPNIRALQVMPNGTLVAAGGEDSAGNTVIIESWDGAAWSTLGTGTGIAGGLLQDYDWGTLKPTHFIYTLAVMPSGALFVGGSFTQAGGLPTSNVAVWNGSSWSPLGTNKGTNDIVAALAALPNGGLVAGGRFFSIEGVAANRIALRNGTTWSAMGIGIDAGVAPNLATQTIVNAVAVMPNGDIIAGGTFTTAGNVTVNGIARWNGSSWFALGSGVTGTVPSPRGPSGLPPSVSALAVMPNGDLIAGGNFLSAGGVTVNGIARWNGSAWSALGTGIDGEGNSATFADSVNALAVMANGDLIAGGSFLNAGGVLVNDVARWNGSSWAALGAGLYGSTVYNVSALAVMPNGDLIVGGNFGIYSDVGDLLVYNIGRWNGTAWSSLGNGLRDLDSGGNNTIVNALLVLPNGDLIAGGNITTVDNLHCTGCPLPSDVAITRIARWDGTTWSALGTGIDKALLGGVAHLAVDALARTSDGLLVAGGNFAIAGGTVSANLARWSDCAVQSSGACCTGTHCSVVTGSVACTGSYKGNNSVCGTPNNPTTCCPANFDGMNGVNVNDIFAFLRAWFAHSSTADIDGVNGVNVNDIFAFLRAWFAKC